MKWLFYILGVMGISAVTLIFVLRFAGGDQPTLIFAWTCETFGMAMLGLVLTGRRR